MLSLVKINQSSIVKYNNVIPFSGNSVQQLQDHYNDLEADLDNIYKKAEKNPVNKNNQAPEWIIDLEKKTGGEKGRWNMPVSEFLFNTANNKKKLEFLQKQHSQYSLFEEQNKPDHCSNIITEVNSYSNLNSIYSDLEAKISGMGADSKAVFVGSGSQPNTVFSYAKHAGEIIGLDFDANAVNTAKKFLQKNNLEMKNKIKFEHKDGQKFNYGNCTHIGIAAMVPNEQKIRIFDQIRRTAKPGTIVIIRSTNGLKQALFPPFIATDKQLKGFKKIAKLEGDDSAFVHSQVFRLEESGSVFNCLI